MKLAVVDVDIGSKTPMVLLNTADATELGVHTLDRVLIDENGHTVTGIVEITDQLVEKGTMGVTRPLGRLEGPASVRLAPKPDSVEFIRKKLRGHELDQDEIASIVTNVKRDRLSDVELTSFVTGIFTEGLSHEEMEYLTAAMVDAGETLSWSAGVVADKHSIGGVAGNRVTPILVPIVAAAGLTIPKTSSRAVTSAAGTADTLEVFCDVEFSLEEIREIVRETSGCMVWGGGVLLSPVDDKIIRVETPLSIDPQGQVVASVLSKKKSAGSSHVVIDIPYGEGAKTGNLTEARAMAEDFERVGEKLGMVVECAITNGQQPIGRGIGPVLEARDVLAVLDGDGPPELRNKAIRLADVLFDACGVQASATSILEDGRAMAKFREIVAAQNGDPDVEPSDLQPGSETVRVESPDDGVVTHVDNKVVNEAARRAGSPRDHGAGIRLAVREGDPVSVGDELFRIHAEKLSKLSEAESFVDRRPPIRVGSREEVFVERFRDPGSR